MKKKIFLSLLTIAVLGYACFFFVEKHEKSLSATPTSLKQALETQMQENMSAILNKIMVSDAYIMSVYLDVQERHTEKETLTKKPLFATETSSEKTTEDARKYQHAIQQKNPSHTDIKQQLSESNNSLVKLTKILRTKSASGTDLPGFPVIKKQTTSTKPTKKQTVSTLTENTQKIVYFNEEKTRLQSPTTTISNVMITLFIDQDYFTLLDMKKTDLKSIIQSSLALNKKRGDTLKIMYVPFAGKAFPWIGLYTKNKQPIHTILNYSAGIVAVITLLLLLISLEKRYKNKKQHQLSEKIDQEKLTKQKQQQDTAQRLLKIEDQKATVLKFANSSPKHFAELLSNWIETPKEETIGSTHDN